LTIASKCLRPIVQRLRLDKLNGQAEFLCRCFAFLYVSELSETLSHRLEIRPLFFSIRSVPENGAGASFWIAERPQREAM